MLITKVCTVFFWLLTGLAVADMTINHNPTAINGVLGAGFWAVMFTILWIQDVRDASATHCPTCHHRCGSGSPGCR